MIIIIIDSFHWFVFAVDCVVSGTVASVHWYVFAVDCVVSGSVGQLSLVCVCC